MAALDFGERVQWLVRCGPFDEGDLMPILAGAKHGGNFRKFGIEWDYNNPKGVYISFSFYKWLWVWTCGI